jgi:hypothetical protein
MKDLQLNLKELAKNKQVKDLSSFLRNHGFTRGEVRTLLDPKVDNYKGKHLSRLMKIFDCTGNELLLYVGTDPNHPMAKLRPLKGVDMQEVVSGLSTAQTVSLAEEMIARAAEMKKEK